MSELPKVDSVWGVVDRPETWVYVYGIDRYNISHTHFDRVEERATTGETSVSNWTRWVKDSGAVDIKSIVSGARKPSILRTDTEGRDVTDLPGLWSEDDTITDSSQPQTVEEVFNRFAEDGWSGDAAALGIDGFKKAVALLGIVPATAKGGE